MSDILKNEEAHISHCCQLHGCKYLGGVDCPVYTRRRGQRYPCEDCDYEIYDVWVQAYRENAAYDLGFKRGRESKT